MAFACRIAIAEALLKNHIALDHTAQQHIDSCLLCRRCETVCPSKVGYEKIIDRVRQEWSNASWSSQLAKAPKLLTHAYQAGRLYPNWLPQSPAVRLAQALKPQQQPPRSGTYLPSGKTRAKVGLLLGCVTRAAQADALHASIRLLNALQYAVVVPAEQGCCGALAFHQGEQKAAEKMAETLRKAFTPDLDAVLTTASGCAAYWQTHPFAELATYDMVVFLAQTADLQHLTFKPLAKKIALHQPCTLMNGLSATEVQKNLIAQIPGIEICELSTADTCCGAAGNHMLTRRQQAEALRQPLLDELAANQPDYLVTSNIGCALHLAEGIQHTGLQIPVMHPVELLEKQL